MTTKANALNPNLKSANMTVNGCHKSEMNGVETKAQKMTTFSEVIDLIGPDRRRGQTVVQCHGAFDLIHPGHIRHFEEARKLGDILIISVTSDRFVNKGPGRPVFNQNLRMESIAALSVIDYVVLSDSPDAVLGIRTLKPDVYVKGYEYQEHNDDITGKISEEANAVMEGGGRVHYTNDIVFSSSAILNEYFDSLPSQAREFLHKMKQKYSDKQLHTTIEKLSKLKVLVIGDAIVDEYQYVTPLGQSGKGINMVGLLQDREVFLGGSLAIAAQLAQFTNHVTLLTALGKDCPFSQLIHAKLPRNVNARWFNAVQDSTLTKKRYIIKDGQSLSKLFETYSSVEQVLDDKTMVKIQKFLVDNDQKFDLVLVTDFGNGFFQPIMMDTISELKGFVALNTQANSGNRGFNVATHYKRTNFLSLNIMEARLAAQDRYHPMSTVIKKICTQMENDKISITDGVNGMSGFIAGELKFTVPALGIKAVDRVGAGDTFFGLASLCLAANVDFEVAAFLGAAAAAIDIQIVANKDPVGKVPLCKFVTRLLK